MSTSPIGMPHITGLYETHITVSDLDRSIEFYRDVLGLELSHYGPDGDRAFLWIGDKTTAMLGLWCAPKSPLKMQLHFAFSATKDDILSAPEALRTKGVTPLGFHGEPVTEPVVLGWMPALSLYLKDPDGHSVEYIALLNEAPDPQFGTGPFSRWISR